MKILHVTDSHGTVKSPEGRRDIYYVAFLKKLYELGYVCKKMNIDMVIHTGDLFHSARVSNKFAGQTAEMIKAMGIPFYVVPGNHDIEGYTISTIDQTTLGLLAKAGVVTLLDRDHSLLINVEDNDESFNMAISGQEYYAHIDEGNDSDFDMQQDEADFNILAIHGYIADTPQHPDIKCTMAQNISTNADIILAGHYHHQFEFNGAGFDIFNPGSMMRIEQTEYNKTHIPQYGILDVFLNDNGELVYNYKFYNFRVAQPSTVIFDYDSKYVQKHASISLEGFKTSIANTMSNVAPTTNLLQLIENVCLKEGVSERITNLALDTYNNTLQNIPDEFEAPPGYIEAPKTKMIKSVYIHGFQSHKDSLLEFDNGLNIIVGSSNVGKSAIFRAIMWVIDNKPLGTDFITADSDECIVCITYTDGTYIERGRTRKDTGYYLITYYDDAGKLHQQTYRGFTNAVPVEVINNHQMPLVNITKDIETHLNVLSQLDHPFLISESPQNKAAAIGRITGTHVIDASVKELARTIRATSIAVSEHKTDLTNEQNGLNALPDYNTLHGFTVFYAKVVDVLIKHSQIFEQVQANWKAQIDIRNQIMLTASDVSKKKVIASLFPVVNSAEEQVSLYLALSKAYSELKSVETRIKSNKNFITDHKPLADFAPTISSILNRVQKYIYLRKAYDEYQVTSYRMTTAENVLNTNGVLHCHLSAILNYVRTKVSKDIEIEYDYNTYVFGKKQMKDAKKIKSSYEKQIRVISSQISEVSKDMISYVTQVGICPCCGQSVQTKEHAQNIIHYMEVK